MSNYNIRVSKQSYQALKSLSRETGSSMQAVVDRAIEDLRRKKLLEETNAAFSALKKDKKAWKEELAERENWENTLLDGAEKE